MDMHGLVQRGRAGIGRVHHRSRGKLVNVAPAAFARFKRRRGRERPLGESAHRLTRTYISASIDSAIWNGPIGLPNCSRVMAYFSDRYSARSAIPDRAADHPRSRSDR